MEPAEVPERTTWLLSALVLSALSKRLGDPSSSTQDRTCLAWSPPLKNTISASCNNARLALPSAVLILPAIL